MEYKTIYFNKNQFEDYMDFMRDHNEDNNFQTAMPRRKWWIFENIYDGYFILAYDKNEVVSTCFLSGKKIINDGVEISCFEIGETWTSINHRRKGLFTKMVNKAMEVGNSAGAKIIYGTPNAQSAPGYKKLNYNFIEDNNDFLIFIPNIFNIALNKIGIMRDKGVHNIKMGGLQKSILKNIKVMEIGFNEYLNKTIEFQRMNYVCNEYLEWRFEESIHEYRYFYGEGNKGKFYCVAKPHRLGNLECILISEYFLNEKLGDTTGQINFLKAIGSIYYRNFDGIYLKSHICKSSLKYVDMIKNVFIIHRQIPICYIANSINERFVNSIMINLSKSYQLSDCDIG